MKISIALCTYNGEKFIREQLESLLQQTLKPDEIVISDDGSSDDTLNIIHEMEKDSSIPFVYFKHDEKLGVFRNFAQTISHCSNELIFPCDQDDVWKLDKLEKHVNEHMKHPHSNLVFSNADVVFNTIDHHLYPLWDPKKVGQSNGYANIVNLVYKGRSIAGCCMSFKKEFYDLIQPIPEGIYHDDWIATCAVLLGEVRGISESLIYYRQHGNNTVGIVRGSRLSYYKSLFTNPMFYVESDSYIYSRHLKVFKALEKHEILSKTLDIKTLDQVLALYKSRSNYREKSYAQAIGDLNRSLMEGRYHFLHGFWTYLKDLYNLSFMKLSKR